MAHASTFATPDKRLLVETKRHQAGTAVRAGVGTAVAVTGAHSVCRGEALTRWSYASSAQTRVAIWNAGSLVLDRGEVVAQCRWVIQIHQQHIPNRVGGLAGRSGAQRDRVDVPIRWVGDVGETPCTSVPGDGTGSDGVLFGAGRGWAILGRNGPIGGAIRCDRTATAIHMGDRHARCQGGVAETAVVVRAVCAVRRLHRQYVTLLVPGVEDRREAEGHAKGDGDRKEKQKLASHGCTTFRGHAGG